MKIDMRDPSKREVQRLVNEYEKAHRAQEKAEDAADRAMDEAGDDEDKLDAACAIEPITPFDDLMKQATDEELEEAYDYLNTRPSLSEARFDLLLSLDRHIEDLKLRRGRGLSEKTELIAYSIRMGDWQDVWDALRKMGVEEMVISVNEIDRTVIESREEVEIYEKARHHLCRELEHRGDEPPPVVSGIRRFVKRWIHGHGAKP